MCDRILYRLKINATSDKKLCIYTKGDAMESISFQELLAIAGMIIFTATAFIIVRKNAHS